MMPIRTHEQERPHARKVTFGRVAPERKRAERSGGDEEGADDALARVDEEDRRQGQTHQSRIDPEGCLCRSHAHVLNAEAQEEHQRKRCENDNPAEGAGIDELAESRELAVGDGKVERAKGCKAGDRQAERHKVVDADHIGAQALVDGRVRAHAGRCAGLIVTKVSHNYPFLA